jgi:transcriptional regulator with XRE-family HTH domain
MSKVKRPEATSVTQREIGDRIALVRQILDRTQKEIADALGIDPSTISKIEDGSRAPSVFNVISLATRFQCSTDFLLRGHLTGRTDEELSLVIVARRPDLAPKLQRRDLDTGTGSA